MSNTHLTRELLRAVARGELPPRVVVQVGLEHLTSICPRCRAEFVAWQSERAPHRGADYSRTFAILPRMLEEQAPRLERERKRARRDLELLLSLPPAERPGRVRRARTRFRGQALASSLLEESRQQAQVDARSSLHLAELARTVVERSPGVAGELDLMALANAYVANAHRALGELHAAAERFAHARHFVAHGEITDPEVLARIDELEGSLRKDQRLFEEAEKLLARAALLFRTAGSTRQNVHVLIKLADVRFYSGDVERAVETLRPALEILDREHDGRTYLSARHNLAIYLTELGRPLEAAKILDAERELYARFPEPSTQLRLSWLEARIAAGERNAAAAEGLFQATRDGFVREGCPFHAALVALDLMRLYLGEGETGEVRRLAEEVLPVFQAQDARRETRRLHRYLRDAQAGPSLRQQSPS
jgi:tetratricopeptide (TPR) repeat protein